MAWVFPVSSRLSVTIRWTGWATVTFGGGGGWGFGVSLQPARITASAVFVNPAEMRGVPGGVGATNLGAAEWTAVDGRPADCRSRGRATRPSSYVAPSLPCSREAPDPRLP